MWFALPFLHLQRPAGQHLPRLRHHLQQWHRAILPPVGPGQRQLKRQRQLLQRHHLQQQQLKQRNLQQLPQRHHLRRSLKPANGRCRLNLKLPSEPGWTKHSQTRVLKQRLLFPLLQTWPSQTVAK